MFKVKNFKITTINSDGMGMFLSCFLNFSFTNFFKTIKKTIQFTDIVNAIKFIDWMFLNIWTYAFECRNKRKVNLQKWIKKLTINFNSLLYLRNFQKLLVWFLVINSEYMLQLSSEYKASSSCGKTTQHTLRQILVNYSESKNS